MALFTDTDDFKKHAPDINRNYAWERELKPKIDQITKLRITPFISEAQLTVLESAYAANSLDTAQESLLTSLQPAIAYYVYLHLLTTNRVSLGAMGVQESRSDDGTSSPASFHAIADVKEEISEMAYSFFDMSLEFMEANKSSFGPWANSDSYTEIKKCFVWSTKIFNQYIRAGGSRHTFLSIRPEMIHVQENEVKNELGEALYNALFTGFTGGTLSTENQKLIPLLQAWIAPAAMIRAVPVNRVKIEGGQIMIRSKLDGPERKTAAPNDPIRHVLDIWEKEAEKAKISLLKFLESNSTSYPLYTNTQHTLEDGKTSYKIPNNKNKKSFRV